MEDNFIKDDFEQFLKGNADEFLMVPQRKVWYSIYNSMHPDRKWPSLAVCLLILSAVLFLGISNNNSISDAARKAGAENLSSIAKSRLNDNDNNAQLSGTTGKTGTDSNAPSDQTSGTVNNNSNTIADNNTILLADANRLATDAERNDYPTLSAAKENIGNTTMTAPFNNENAVVISANSNSSSQIRNSSAHQNNLPVVTNAGKAAPENNSFVQDADNDAAPVKEPVVAAINNAAVSAIAVADASLAGDKKNTTKKDAAKMAVVTIEQKAWMEDFAFHNQAGKSKFKRNASLSYYVTPSMGYRTILRKSGYTPAGSLLLASRYVPSLHESLLDGAALNLEAGAAINYGVAKNIRLKGGVQFNYTNYITNGTELGHPTQASVALMPDASPMFRSTNFSVDGDQDKFNHRSVQVSIPLGADVEIAGNDHLKWYAGATLQPTFILGGKSLVLSADEKNLITENTLRRNWNLNMGVETFLSYKTKSGINFNVGPQFRYQMLSTFKKQYAYNERPYNLGIKLGITKGF
jgi:hypothetical protein